MKKLFLIRHAKSSWADPTVIDFHRTLNKRGKKDAPFMAQRLAETGVIPDGVLSSPAKRAKKTARCMAQGVGFSKDLIVYDDSIYSASALDLIRILQMVNNKNNTMFLVGHNYAITDLAELLTDEIIDNIPTSGIVAMDCRIKVWSKISPGCAKILFFDYPKRHKVRR